MALAPCDVPAGVRIHINALARCNVELWMPRWRHLDGSIWAAA